ncbi:hypothetical protein Tco_0267018 [Tanacetum coccineum]
MFLLSSFGKLGMQTLEDGDMGITAIIDGKVKVVFEASIRRHLKLEDSDGISTLSTAEIFKQLALMGYVSNSDSLTFQKGHFSPQWKFLIHTILHCLSSEKTAWEQFSSNIATAIICLATNRTFNFSKLIFKAMVKNLDNDEDDLEDPSKQGRKIAQIDEDEGITLVQMGAQTQWRSDEDLMYETGVYGYPEGFIGPSISITTVEPVTTAGERISTARAIPKEVSTTESDIDVTLAEALVDLLKSGKKKSPKPKARGISFQDPEEVARREVISPPVSKILAKDKGKAIMTKPEKPLKKKDQIQSDEELALRLHAEEQAEFERLQKERAAQEEASRAAIYDEMDNIQAMIEVNEQLAARVQAEEQELYSIKEKSRLLVEMIAERKRFFAAQRAAEQRSKPPTKTHMRNRMCTYLKNMGGYKQNQLKGKSYEEI